jgi:hypothetical protein
MTRSGDEQCYKKSIEWDLSCSADEALELIPEYAFKPKVLSFQYFLDGRSYVGEVEGNRFRLWSKMNRAIVLTKAEGEIHEAGKECHLSGRIAVTSMLTHLPFGVKTLVIGVLLLAFIMPMWFVLAISEYTSLTAVCFVLLFAVVSMGAYASLRLFAISQLQELEELFEKVWGKYRLQRQQAESSPNKALLCKRSSLPGDA